MTSIVGRIKAYRAKRRAERPERLQRRAAAKALRLEHKRRTPLDGGGGG